MDEIYLRRKYIHSHRRLQPCCRCVRSHDIRTHRAPARLCGTLEEVVKVFRYGSHSCQGLFISLRRRVRLANRKLYV